jgi:protease I
MRALIISADGFEDQELLVPRDALRADGFTVNVVTPGAQPIHGKRGALVDADGDIGSTDPASYDLLVLPGGKAPAQLRKDPKVLSVAREFMVAGKPVAAVCHGPQILVAAGVLRGRKATAYAAVAGELKAAGADYIDDEVVVDGNLITSRKPADLPAFVRAIRRTLGNRAARSP